jgi:hypothetical protein
MDVRLHVHSRSSSLEPSPPAGSPAPEMGPSNLSVGNISVLDGDLSPGQSISSRVNLRAGPERRSLIRSGSGLTVRDTPNSENDRDAPGLERELLESRLERVLDDISAQTERAVRDLSNIILDLRTLLLDRQEFESPVYSSDDRPSETLSRTEGSEEQNRSDNWTLDGRHQDADPLVEASDGNPPATVSIIESPEEHNVNDARTPGQRSQDIDTSAGAGGRHPPMALSSTEGLEEQNNSNNRTLERRHRRGRDRMPVADQMGLAENAEEQQQITHGEVDHPVQNNAREQPMEADRLEEFLRISPDDVNPYGDENEDHD